MRLAWIAALASVGALASGGNVAISARLDGRAASFPAGRAGGPAAVLVNEALSTLARCDEVVRMMATAQDVDALRARSHVDLQFDPARVVTTPALKTPLPVAELFVPLGSARTRPDWYVYVRRDAARPLFEVYRRRGAPQSALDALRGALAGALTAGSP